MIPITYKPNIPDSLTCTDHQYMKKLKEHYGKDIVTPRCSIETFIEWMQETLFLKREDLENLDAMTYDTLKFSVFPTEAEVLLWMLPENEQSRIFYDYFHKRFYRTARIGVLYLKEKDCFISNCSMLDIYLEICRGIDQKEIEEDTEIYRNYLNLLFMYNNFLLSIENNK